MTVQPFAAYCLANSSPMPEFAPVMRTVSAAAVAGNAASMPAITAAGSATTHPASSRGPAANEPASTRLTRPEAAPIGLNARLTMDVALELLDRLLLLLDDGLHEVADRYDADHFAAADHWQMADAVLSHEPHAIVHRVLWGDRHDGRAHDLGDRCGR